MGKVLITFIVLLFLSGILGYGLTWLPTLTDDSWQSWALARVIWSLGSAIGIAGTVAIAMLLPDRVRAPEAEPETAERGAQPGTAEVEAPRPLGRRILDAIKFFFIIGVFSIPLGVLFCLAPLTDLVRGPVERDVASVHVESGTGSRHRTVHYRLEVELTDGETLRSGGCLSAPHAPTWQRLAEPCLESQAPMRVRFLRAMMAPLTVECLDPGRPPR